MSLSGSMIRILSDYYGLNILKRAKVECIKNKASGRIYGF
jgi:rRNA processing protein Krr1/Pno1